MHAAEHDDEAAAVALRLELRVARLEAGRHEGEDERGPRVVEVGEVGAVGLVQVVVDLEERRVRGQDVRREDRVDRRRGAGQGALGRFVGAHVRDRVIEEAEVPDQRQVFEVQDREEEEEEVAEG